MEWYYIVAIILSSLGAVSYIVNRVNNLVRDTKNNTNEIDELKEKMTEIILNNKNREEVVNEIKSDIKLINQKFDIYIHQLIELNQKADIRLTALEKHTQGCLISGKSLKDIKDLIK